MAKRKEYSIFTIAGRVNIGKSSILNLLSGQKDFALVDPQPGTTADTVVTKMEIHELGPIKILDTAGIDEYSPLGEKKRKKTFEAVEEADLTIIVVDLLKAIRENDFTIEKEVAEKIAKYNKQALIIYNVFQANLPKEKLIEMQKTADQKIGLDLPSLAINALEQKEQKRIIDFINQNFKKEYLEIDLIPLKGKRGFVLFNIPMDKETPALRLLRPQDMAMERILRKFMIPVLFRLDLKKARANNQAEKKRFLDLLNQLRCSPEGLKLIITDSQAIDILGNWVPAEVPLTTFSIMMTNYMSGGNLKLFVKGIEALASLKDNDKILIMEACNHNRQCDDIGTQQIPRLIKNKLDLNLQIDFSFGRVLPENLGQYKLAIHCGGCMIDRQKYMRRVAQLQEAGVAVTNYGLFLSWMHHPETLKKACRIFGC